MWITAFTFLFIQAVPHIKLRHEISTKLLWHYFQQFLVTIYYHCAEKVALFNTLQNVFLCSMKK